MFKKIIYNIYIQCILTNIYCITQSAIFVFEEEDKSLFFSRVPDPWEINVMAIILEIGIVIDTV